MSLRHGQHPDLPGLGSGDLADIARALAAPITYGQCPGDCGECARGVRCVDDDADLFLASLEAA